MKKIEWWKEHAVELLALFAGWFLIAAMTYSALVGRVIILEQTVMAQEKEDNRLLDDIHEIKENVSWIKNHLIESD